MKLTRILPRILAVEWQRYDLNHVDSELEFHKSIDNLIKKALKAVEKTDNYRHHVSNEFYSIQFLPPCRRSSSS